MFFIPLVGFVGFSEVVPAGSGNRTFLDESGFVAPKGD
jgi:hypothetical protein